MTHIVLLQVTGLILKLHMQFLRFLPYSLILNCNHIVPDPLRFNDVFIIYNV